MRSYVLFDLDGCVRPHAMGKSPIPPVRGLGLAFHGLRESGLLVAAATGGCLRDVRTTEGHLRFRFDDVSTGYGARHVRRGGYTPSERILAPQDQEAAMGEISADLDKILVKFNGHLSERGVCYAMFFTAGSESFLRARRAVGELLEGNSKLRFMANWDGGICILPAAVDKRLIVHELKHGLGRSILVAAGDAAPDLPLVQEAEFPIICRRSVGFPLDEALVEVVRSRGVGYLAAEDEPHGLGLLKGLEVARTAGVI